LRKDYFNRPALGIMVDQHRGSFMPLAWTHTTAPTCLPCAGGACQTSCRAGFVTGSPILGVV
jgi:hypothetical protein